MIPADLVFITVPATTDFTGPIIGIVGVLIGSGIGFFGLFWQQKKQREYDLRVLVANLLAAGEEIKDDYIAKRNTALGTERTRAWLGVMDDKLNELYRHLRHIELVAPVETANAAKSFATLSGQFHTYAYSKYGAGNRPDDDQLKATSGTWELANTVLINSVNRTRSRRYTVLHTVTPPAPEAGQEESMKETKDAE